RRRGRGRRSRRRGRRGGRPRPCRPRRGRGGRGPRRARGGGPRGRPAARRRGGGGRSDPPPPACPRAPRTGPATPRSSARRSHPMGWGVGRRSGRGGTWGGGGAPGKGRPGALTPARRSSCGRYGREAAPRRCEGRVRDAPRPIRRGRRAYPCAPANRTVSPLRMKLIVPMAGRGTRLRPHTHVTPKPLLPVVGRSMVERIVETFAGVLPRGLDEAVFVLGPDFGDEVRRQLADICARHGLEPHFAVQEKALGTGHAVLQAGEHLDGECVVVFADTLFAMDAAPDLD